MAQMRGKTHTRTPRLVCEAPHQRLHSPGVPRGDADCRHCQLTLAWIVTGLPRPADRLSTRRDFGLMGISETLQQPSVWAIKMRVKSKKSPERRRGPADETGSG